MIDSIKTLKVKPLKEWFNASIPSDAIDLISKMLDFNPHRRPTAVQILQHPYLSQFHNPHE
jgi:serine/threonine protein kinase